VVSEEALVGSRVRCEGYGGWFEEHDVVRVMATGNGIRAQKGWWIGSCRLTSTCIGAPRHRFKRC
jgi:hypothetical protein